MNEGSQDSSSPQRAQPSHQTSNTKNLPGPSSIAIEGRNSSRNSIDLDNEMQMTHSQKEEGKEESSGQLTLRIKTLDNSEFEVQVPEEGKVSDLK